MKRGWISCRLVFAVMMLCLPAWAYQLAMKDGRIVECQKCRVENAKVVCADASGKETSVALADVDLERTKSLNAKETPPLDLPPAGTPGGATAENAAAPHSASPAEEQSLGDAARNLRQQGKAHAATQKRTFTDEDVRSAGSSGAAPMMKTVAEDKKPAGGAEGQKAKEKQEEADDEEVTEQDFSEYYDLDREQTARGILSYGKLPPDTPFPDRGEWEFRLYDAKQDMVHAYMHAKGHQDDPSAREDLRQKWNQFATIANEGIKRATAYLQMHPQG